MLRRAFYPALRRAGLRRVRFHDLRHTFASLLIAQNVHPKRIQALMGHSTIKVTMHIYGHLMGDGDNEAALRVAELVFGPRAPKSGSKTVARGKTGLRKARQAVDFMVARGGIEPPTRGFSVRCSTD